MKSFQLKAANKKVTYHRVRNDGAGTSLLDFIQGYDHSYSDQTQHKLVESYNTSQS